MAGVLKGIVAKVSQFFSTVGVILTALADGILVLPFHTMVSRKAEGIGKGTCSNIS